MQTWKTSEESEQNKTFNLYLKFDYQPEMIKSPQTAQKYKMKRGGPQKEPRGTPRSVGETGNESVWTRDKYSPESKHLSRISEGKHNYEIYITPTLLLGFYFAWIVSAASPTFLTRESSSTEHEQDATSLVL